MYEKRKAIVQILAEMFKLLFATLVLGHYIYPEKIGNKLAIIGFIITIVVGFVIWLVTPTNKEEQ